MIEVPQNSTTKISTTETSATTFKKRGEGRRYYCTNSCENLEEAMNLIKEERLWTVKNKTINTIFYRCNLQSKRAKPECSAAIYIHKHKNNNKKYICKYIIGIAIRTIPEIRKSIPLAAKNLPLTSKRKTGRPALAKKALVRQPFVSILRADDEVLDLNDEIDDDIDYDAETDEVLNHNYEVYDNQRDFQNAYDCGIDLNEQQNIINLIGSLDTESLSSVNTQSTISTATDEDTYF